MISAFFRKRSFLAFLPGFGRVELFTWPALLDDDFSRNENLPNLLSFFDFFVFIEPPSPSESE